MNFRSLPVLSCLLVGWLASVCSQSEAQTATGPFPTTDPFVNFSGGPTIVYQITFDSVEDGINYSPYENGYYVAASAGGSGTLLLTKTKGATKSLYVYTDFGQLFPAQDGDRHMSVVTCTASSSVSTTAIFATGTADDTIKDNSASVTGEIYFAHQLTGYAVSADVLADQLFIGSASSDFGTAGISKITLSYDDADTNLAAVNNVNVAGAVAAIQKRITGQGFTLANQNTTGTGGTGTGVGTGVDNSKAATDLLIYSLSFKRMGDSINYAVPLGGYYVTTAVASTGSGNTTAPVGSLILEVKGPGTTKYMRVFPNFGNNFVAKSQNDRKGVLFAMDANDVSSTFFFGMGEARETMPIKSTSGHLNANFARKLKGYAFSADSNFDLEFLGAPATDLGVAGMCAMTATYDETRTLAANKVVRTLGAELTLLQTELKAQGFTLLTTGN